MAENMMPMAWNEPGGGKKRDPWGGNRGNDGPPDLDQIFKNFKERIGALFGGGGSSGGQVPVKGMGVGLALLLVVIAAAYVLLGFFTISPYEQGVITRFGKYNRTVNEGLHWVPRFIDQVKRINTENLSSSHHSGWMLTKDENILLVEIEVHYRVIDSEKYLFNVRDPDVTLRQAADSALRQVVGESLTDDVLTEKKQQIGEAIKEQLISILGSYDIGFHIAAVNFKDSKPPEQVKDAFDDVTKSREDKERLKLQADAYYNKMVPEAEGMAKKMVLEAEAYKQEVILAADGETKKFNLVLPEYQKAPDVTKTRLYLDAMEEVLENTSKVLIDVDSGNNLIYLPIDKLMKESTNIGPASIQPNKPEQQSLQDANVQRDVERSSRSRRRRG